MKKIINSNLFTRFRKSYLKTIYKRIYQRKADFCCHVHSIHSCFIYWKELKEVKENMDSAYLLYHIRKNKKHQTCFLPWFAERNERLGFLKECLDKFN